MVIWLGEAVEIRQREENLDKRRRGRYDGPLSPGGGYTPPMMRRTKRKEGIWTETSDEHGVLATNGMSGQIETINLNIKTVIDMKPDWIEERSEQDRTQRRG